MVRLRRLVRLIAVVRRERGFLQCKDLIVQDRVARIAHDQVHVAAGILWGYLAVIDADIRDGGGDLTAQCRAEVDLTAEAQGARNILRRRRADEIDRVAELPGLALAWRWLERIAGWRLPGLFVAGGVQQPDRSAGPTVANK